MDITRVFLLYPQMKKPYGWVVWKRSRGQESPRKEQVRGGTDILKRNIEVYVRVTNFYRLGVA